MIVVAHVGHWLVNLLYAAPILALVILLVWDRLKNRGADPEAGDDAPAERESTE